MKRRSTPAGEHRPVLLEQVLEVLRPGPGMTAVDCTAGFGGHAAAFLSRIQPGGRLLALDMDGEHLDRVRERLAGAGDGFEVLHANFAGLDRILMEREWQADLILADLGMSSMQVDDPGRGFSYARDGDLDMRMDRSRGKPAWQVLRDIEEKDLAQALEELGDEPEARTIAQAVVAARQKGPLMRTSELAGVIQQAVGSPAKWRLRPAQGKWTIHPAARSFQALRILVNRELANLIQLLRVLPTCLAPGGRAGIVSFHSGEDRLVKKAFQEGLRLGIYTKISEDAVRPTYVQRQDNPRSRSAKLRWAIKNDRISLHHH